MVDVLWHPVPADYYGQTFQADRPLAGIGIHDTETDTPAAPHAAGSWHYEIDRAGKVHGYVPEADVAYHVKAWGTDPTINKWRPPWLPLSRPWNASATNCWTLGVELVSSQKWRNQGTPYTLAQYRSLQGLLLDLRERYGPLPVFGHGHVQSDRADPKWFDWAAVLAVLPETDAIMPLVGAQRSSPLAGGYAFCELTQDGVYHPGVDLNVGGGDADLGLPVRAPAECVVRFTERWDGRTKGEGTHVWAEAATGHWFHWDHLSRLDVTAGTVLARGATLGACGKSGGWLWSHLHWEVAYAKPSTWWQWTRGWSKDRVLQTYMDPFAYLCAVWPAPGDGGEENPEMEDPVLNDAELTWKLTPDLWGEHFNPETIEWAIPVRWRAEYRRGNQLGRPLGPEHGVPDVPEATVQHFERGSIVARKVDGAWRTSLVG